MAEKSTLTDYMDICDDLSRQLDREKKLHRQANAMRLQQMDRDSEEITRLRRQNQELRDALKPFAAIEPSSFYPRDGSEAEGYGVILSAEGKTDFTGADLARARAVLASQEATGEARTGEGGSGATQGPE